MSLTLAGAALIGSALASGVGAFASASQNSKAKQAEQENYDKSRGTLLTDYYTSPLDSISNQALLKQMDERVRQNNEAIENKAIAGGATFENTLAAKNAANQTIANAQSDILRSEEARRRAIQSQLLSLDSAHTGNIINNYRANSQNWGNWASGVSSGLINLGAIGVENGGNSFDFLWKKND